MIRSKRETLVLGAVAYDPKVVTIWDGFQRFFGEHGVPFDYVLYTNYERQVEGHFAGEVDLGRETQLLNVRVQPALSSGVSAGAAVLFIANPLLGAAVGAGALASAQRRAGQQSASAGGRHRTSGKF